MQKLPSDALVIDGSYGEGGGQILRTALSLAALTGRSTRLENIRARRRIPGLAAQHLTAVRAAAEICQAHLEGDSLGSDTIDFRPEAPVRSGQYLFDVAAAREGGSAGSATLVLQTVLLPLAFAQGDSEIVVRGGTHLPWSPPYDYVEAVWLPLLRHLGLTVSLTSGATGWFPIGQGEITARIAGLGAAPSSVLRPLDLRIRGRLVRITGRAIAADLPSHIPQRMADRARTLLQPLDVELCVMPKRVRAACPGAGLFLTAEYENARCGFSVIGERGKSSEAVADEAVALLTSHLHSGAAVDLHLADQILAPLALAAGPSLFSTERVRLHLESNAWVIERFGLADVSVERHSDVAPLIRVVPRKTE